MFELNSRELAILIWLAAVLIVLLFIPKVRPALGNVVRAFFQPMILMAIGLVLAWVGLSVAILATFQIWDWSHLKGTLVWVVTYGLATLFDINRLSETPRALASLAKEAVAVTAVIVFIGEFYTLPLWGELILIPLLVFLGMVAAVADTKPETKIAARFTENILIIAGLGMFAFSAFRIITDLQAFANLDTLRDFAVPALLSLMYLPFLYGLLLFMAYENATISMKVRFDDTRLRHYATLRALIVFGGRIELMRRFKRSMNLADRLDRQTIDRTIREVWTVYRREQNPPYVPREEGWSPFTAQRLLERHDLKTNDYHRLVDDWIADTPPIDVDDGMFPSRMTYCIYGTEGVVTMLKLSLNADLMGTPDVADERFWSVAEDLLHEALGGDAVDEFRRLLRGQDSGEFTIDGAAITLFRQDWGIGNRGGYLRELTIRHPAHVPGING